MSRPADLGSQLADWAGQEPERLRVAQVVLALTDACVDLAGVVAASPLDPLAAARAGGENASGDAAKGLDLQAERLLVDALARTPVWAVCSEESVEPIVLRDGAGLVVALDPIDGSSNIDINAPIGTIFSILPAAGYETALGALLQTGRNQLAAGIVVYGPSTVLMLTVGAGTDIYVLDPADRTFRQMHAKVELPDDALEYAINASNARHWSPSIQAYVSDLVNGSIGPRGRDFNMRWLAALVAETLRILMRGGIYLYPADARPGYAKGRLRLVYEANPVSFLCEQAGGVATDGLVNILDIVPTDPHQKTPFIFGSKNKVERVRRYLEEPDSVYQGSPLFSNRGLFRN